MAAHGADVRRLFAQAQGVRRFARAINAPDGQVGVFYMFCSSDFFTKVTSNPLLTQGNSHFYILGEDGQIIMSDRDEYIATKTDLGFAPERSAPVPYGYFHDDGRGRGTAWWPAMPAWRKPAG